MKATKRIIHLNFKKKKKKKKLLLVLGKQIQVFEN